LLSPTRLPNVIGILLSVAPLIGPTCELLGGQFALYYRPEVEDRETIDEPGNRSLRPVN